MFTGLVECVGRIVALEREAAGRRLVIAPPPFASELSLGDSVAINGCCLTVVSQDGRGIHFQAGPETLQKTNLGELTVGSAVNLERALAANGRFGGHIVQGHVDGVGRIAERVRDGEWETFWIHAGPLASQMVPKGSVTVDGISLTVVQVTSDSFSIALIPHTLEVTTLGEKQAGATVNLETDILGKYVLKYLGQLAGGLSVETLRSTGFVND